MRKAGREQDATINESLARLGYVGVSGSKLRLVMLLRLFLSER